MAASVATKRRPIAALRGSNQANLDHTVPEADVPMQTTLQHLVERYLSQHLMRSAIFCAERIFAHVRSQDNLWILANCYFRNQELQRACTLLANEIDSCPGPGSSSATANHYLLAVCSFRLGNLREAEAALLYRAPSIRLHGPHNCREEILSADNCPVPNGAAGVHLLGLLCARDNRKEFAIEYFTLALTMDPFQWDAYEQLCALGANIPASAFFGEVEGREEHPVSAPTGLFPAEFEGVDAKGQERWMMFNENAVVEDDSDILGERSSLSRSLASSFASPAPAALHAKRQTPSKQQQKQNRSLHIHRVNRVSRPLPVPVPPLAFQTNTTPVTAASAPWTPAAANHKVSYAQVIAALDPTTAHDALLDNLSPDSFMVTALPQTVTGFTSSEKERDEGEVGNNNIRRQNGTSSPAGMNVNQTETVDDVDSDVHLAGRRSTRTRTRSSSNNNNNITDNNADVQDGQTTATTTRRRRSFRATDNKAGGTGGATTGTSAAAAAGTGGASGESQKRPVAERRGTTTTSDDSGSLMETEKSKALALASSVKGSLGVLALFSRIGRGYWHLSEFRCVEALCEFERLPRTQYDTAWVLCQVGRAKFELADYSAGADAFALMCGKDSGRTSGLEFYSTNLWHLKKEVDLCYLARRVIEIDRKSPQVWCVVGNCFSLQKEHDVAIKFFRRALCLDQHFTYAYTLSGHEYVSNEDFDKAVACYRHAIRLDARHYNAWYGLGAIFFRQEKFELAEYHFRRAIAINPRSSVLYCYLGMVLGANNKPDEALRMLERAQLLEPHNPQARFQRAAVLRNMERYEAALEELEAVRNYAPREASVHFLMGKICKQLGRKNDAMLHLTTALDLDPKDSNMIKSAIDKLDVPDIDEEDDL